MLRVLEKAAGVGAVAVWIKAIREILRSSSYRFLAVKYVTVGYVYRLELQYMYSRDGGIYQEQICLKY